MIVQEVFLPTHQLLHRSSCHPGHTKKGIPYGQALRIRRICSEDSFFEKRLGNLENFLFDRGYNRGEIQGQFDRARGLCIVQSLELNG